MVAERVVVGALHADDDVRSVARTLRDAGVEVVYVGGHQSPDQLAGTAVAEDAVRIVVPAGDGFDAIRACLDARGAADIEVGDS